MYFQEKQVQEARLNWINKIDAPRETSVLPAALA